MLCDNFDHYYISPWMPNNIDLLFYANRLPMLNNNNYTISFIFIHKSGDCI